MVTTTHSLLQIGIRTFLYFFTNIICIMHIYKKFPIKFILQQTGRGLHAKPISKSQCLPPPPLFNFLWIAASSIAREAIPFEVIKKIYEMFLPYHFSVNSGNRGNVSWYKHVRALKTLFLQNAFKSSYPLIVITIIGFLVYVAVLYQFIYSI